MQELNLPIYYADERTTDLFHSINVEDSVVIKSAYIKP